MSFGSHTHTHHTQHTHTHDYSTHVHTLILDIEMTSAWKMITVMVVMTAMGITYVTEEKKKPCRLENIIQYRGGKKRKKNLSQPAWFCCQRRCC